MFISSLHFSGLVPPCIRTDTASDYRTTFFKGLEVNVPVFCIIKVITHRGRQRLSRERGPGRTAEGWHIPGQTTRMSWAWLDSGWSLSFRSCDRLHQLTTSQTTGQSRSWSVYQIMHRFTRQSGEKPTHPTTDQSPTPD